MELNQKFIPVITIDGPSGSGKGTISRLVAKKLNWHFLDSGAIYRALAFYAEDLKISLEDEAVLAELALKLPVEFKGTDVALPPEIWINGQEVSRLVRSETCGNSASKIAEFPKVRAALLERQRNFLESPGLVADGRDMGTVVFPNAKIKIFLEASVSERANRRFLQLKDQGLNVTLQSLVAEVKERDDRDKKRAIAPMLPAKDAIVIDTSKMSIQQVEATVLDLVEHHMALQQED